MSPKRNILPIEYQHTYILGLNKISKMKKFISLFFSVILISATGFADKTYTVGTGKFQAGQSGLYLSGNNDPVIVTLPTGGEKNKDISDVQYPAPDNTKMSTFGNQSINIKAAKLHLSVSQTVSYLKIYYHGGESTGIRELSFDGFAIDDTHNTTVPIKSGSSEILCRATINSLPPGEYDVYASGYTGGFIGLVYTIKDNAQKPQNDPKESMNGTSAATIWDFSEVTGTVQLKNYTVNQPYSYARLYYDGLLSYKTSFAGDKISFAKNNDNDYAARDSHYTEGGTLCFHPTVRGAIKVTFSDINPSDDKRQYLRVYQYKGGLERTEYWVSGAEKQQELTTELILVTPNYWYIDAIDEDGNLDGVRISKFEFIPMEKENTEGVINDLFTQRILSTDADGHSVSTWKYCRYKNGTHALVGGVEDNGIIYVSSDVMVEEGRVNDNSNGNIKFSLDDSSSHAYTHYLSSSRASEIYIPVPEGSSGTISVAFTQSETGGEKTIKDDKDIKVDLPPRWFDVIDKDGKVVTTDDIRLNMLAKGSSYQFNSSHIVTFNEQGSYLKLRGSYDIDKEKEIISKVTKTENKDFYKGELKVLSFTVTLDNGTYKYEKQDDDYDHQIGGDHTHAIFNYTEGEINNVGYESGTLATPIRARMTAQKRPVTDEKQSKTEVFKSFRDGDLVRYKNNYYGALQLLRNTDYKIHAPAGYYITTSVRVHGYNNVDDKAETIDDETYVSNMHIGSFEGIFTGGLQNISEYENIHDNTYLEYVRNSDNAETTTLDFTVTATETLNLAFSGYQFLGIVDAVLVPKANVPAIQGQVYYTRNESTTDMSTTDSFTTGGQITYTPKPKEELWWYYVPSNATYESRGCITRTFDRSLNEENLKDLNVNKTFSALNYKFVNATGQFETDATKLGEVYDEEVNYMDPYAQAASAMNVKAPAAVADTSDKSVTIDVSKSGKYYFYVRNNDTNLNSVLAVKTFSYPTGIEEVTVEETDDVPAEYYTLLGVKVDNPQSGIYIVRRGNKVTKEKIVR